MQVDEPEINNNNDNGNDKHDDDSSSRSNLEVGGAIDASTSNLRVNDDTDESVDETEEDAEPCPNEINSTLDRPY